MKSEHQIVEKLNAIDFCKENGIYFVDYYKKNNLKYPSKGKTLCLISEKIGFNKDLSFYAEFYGDGIFFDVVINNHFNHNFNLRDYFEKTNSLNKNKLVIHDYKTDFNNKLDTFLQFLNEIFYSPEINKLITTDYWTEEYCIDIWGNYK